MPKSWFRKSMCVLALLAPVAGCGAGMAEVKQAQASGYDTSFDTVWNATVDALKDDYPVVRVLDKNEHKIVSCWRPVDRQSRDPGAPWRLFRVIVEISPEAPYRVSVSGRAADYSAPQIRPMEFDAFDEPGWRGPRTEHVIRDIHARLAQYARPAGTPAREAANPKTYEVQSDTCVIHPEQMGINPRGMIGFAIGERGAMGLTDD